MPTSTKRKRLLDAYRFAGFRSLEQLHGGDAKSAAQAMSEHLDHIERSLNLRDSQPAAVDLKLVLS